MVDTPFYDPKKSYEENYEQGPFGEFAEVLKSEKRIEKSDQVLSGQMAASARSDIKPHHSNSLDSSQQSNTSYTHWLGQDIDLPFGIPAGPLLNARYCKAAFLKGFDLCVYKTVRTRYYPCHPAPNVLPLELQPDELDPERARQVVRAKSDYSAPLSITNSFGVPSRAPEEWQPDMAAAVAAAKKGQVLIGSFQGTKHEGGSTQEFIADFALAAKLVKETGAKVVEANFSCPNEGSSNLVCFDIPSVQKISYAIKQEIGDTPLIIKLAYFESESHLRDLVKAVGGIVQGMATINTVPATIQNPDGSQALPGIGRLVSGVCGSAIRRVGLEMVGRLHALRIEFGLEFSIIGVGGVMSPVDFHQFRKQGADVVMSATGSMWNPNLAEEIRRTIL